MGYDTTKQHWMLAHHRKYPKQLHPTQNHTHFDHALAEMRAVHGISHHADLIEQATHTKPEQRISVVAMKDSAFFRHRRGEGSDPTSNRLEHVETSRLVRSSSS